MAFVLVACAVAFPSLAIEVPKPAAPSAAAPPAPRIAVVANDETALYERIQQVSQRRALRDLNVADDLIQALARAEVDIVVAALSKLAASNDPQATVALVRLQNWCGRLGGTRPDIEAQIQKLPAELGSTRLARAAGVLKAEAQYMQRARIACGKAQFDYRGIEAQLRQFAAAGQPTSATELAQFTRDAAKREAMLQAAVDKSYAPAMYALATSRLMAVQRGETTENVASIRALLKQAGRTLPRAKLDLANCMALGCDGHPADTASAGAFGLDAARDGEPTAYLSMVRMPWGARFTRVQLLAWQYMGDRLNEAGCLGDGYVMSSLAFAQSIAQLEKGQSEKLVAQAKADADTLWRDHGARAMKEQGCG